MKGILIKANDTIQSSIGSQNAIISAVDKLMDSYQNYLLISEQEQTKRATINSWRGIRLEEIRSQKELLSQYLHHCFAERRTVIDGFFNALDKGLENNNIETINLAISGILGVVQSSPLKDMQNLMLDLKNDRVKEIEF